MGTIMLIILLLFLINFGWACLLTWAICFVAGLLGATLVFSWKLVFAIWIISTLITSVKTVKLKD